MYAISLFTGAGGGDLPAVHYHGWRPVLYCEIDKYCQRIIQQRIADGYLPDAPIFADIRKLGRRELEPYRRLAQRTPVIVTGGFPCQSFSAAGKRKSNADERNMWPDTIRIVREVRPQFVYLENVRGLLSAMDKTTDEPVSYFGTILRDFAEAGYDVRWQVLSAAEVGAPHKRSRLWVWGTLANAERRAS